jgi:hypothetical protein
MEVIRFKTDTDQTKAMGLFHEVTAGGITFSFRKEFPERTCVTNTATVRALQAYGVGFEWLTETV